MHSSVAQTRLAFCLFVDHRPPDTNHLNYGASRGEAGKALQKTEISVISRATDEYVRVFSSNYCHQRSTYSNTHRHQRPSPVQTRKQQASLETSREGEAAVGLQRYERKWEGSLGRMPRAVHSWLSQLILVRAGIGSVACLPKGQRGAEDQSALRAPKVAPSVGLMGDLADDDCSCRHHPVRALGL